MARDLIHQAVREALEAGGWLITHDPLVLKLSGIRFEVDLAAEQVLAAERGPERIAVEIKSFLNKSKLGDFYQAKGQYDVYQEVLLSDKVVRKLYLAVESDIYHAFFENPLIDRILEKGSISVLVLDTLEKRIVQWIRR